MKNKSPILVHNFYHHRDQLYLHYITIILNMTYCSSQFSSTGYQSAILSLFVSS